MKQLLANQMETKREHYPLFDYLRLLLAVSVLFFHAWNQTGPIIRGLFPAVPCFLAISGFVIPPSFEASRNWGHFLWKRFLRVTPALLIALILECALLGFPSVLASLQYYATLGFGRTTAGVGNAPLWSLGWEEILYAILAVLYLVGAYRRPGFILALFIGSALVGLYLCSTRSLGGPASRSFMLPASFYLGNTFYLYRAQIKPSVVAPSLLVICLICYPVMRSQMLLQAIHLLILMAAVLWTGISVLQLPRLRFDLSYGTYVFHYPILVWLRDHGIAGRTSTLVISAMLVAVVSGASWYIFESRALKFKNQKRRVANKEEAQAQARV